ncbi:unnamed protein product, partial [Amoebophrya sp. A25]|eukprot:GSA25T00022642001.1
MTVVQQQQRMLTPGDSVAGQTADGTSASQSQSVSVNPITSGVDADPQTGGAGGVIGPETSVAAQAAQLDGRHTVSSGVENTKSSRSSRRSSAASSAGGGWSIERVDLEQNQALREDYNEMSEEEGLKAGMDPGGLTTRRIAHYLPERDLFHGVLGEGFPYSLYAEEEVDMAVNNFLPEDAEEEFIPLPMIMQLTDYITEQEFAALALAAGYGRDIPGKSPLEKFRQLCWLYEILDCNRKGFVTIEEMQPLELLYYDRAIPFHLTETAATDRSGSAAVLGGASGDGAQQVPGHTQSNAGEGNGGAGRGEPAAAPKTPVSGGKSSKAAADRDRMSADEERRARIERILVARVQTQRAEREFYWHLQRLSRQRWPLVRAWRQYLAPHGGYSVTKSDMGKFLRSIDFPFRLETLWSSLDSDFSG